MAREKISPKFTAIETERVNNEVYASRFSGSGLASKVENALDWLANNVGGQGRVRVTPKDDGTAWSWDKDLTLLVTDYQGVHIDIDESVLIEYPGSGVALTVDGDGGNRGFTNTVKITGGYWINTGDVDVMWRLIDVWFSKFYPAYLDCSGTTNTGTCIEARNRDSWCEVNVFSGHLQGKNGIDFISATQNANASGSGTDSFHGTTISDMYVNVRGGRGITFSGNFNYSLVDNLQLWTKGDGADLMQFEGPWNQFLIEAVKFENVGGYNNIHAVVTTGQYDGFYGPDVVRPRVGSNITNYRADSPSGKSSFVVRLFNAQKFIVEDWDSNNAFTVEPVQQNLALSGWGGQFGSINLDEFNGAVDANGGGPLILQTGGTGRWKLWTDGIAEIPTSTDVSALGSPTNSHSAHMVRHDGSGGYPEGIYVADDANSQWVGPLPNGNNTISY